MTIFPTGIDIPCMLRSNPGLYTPGCDSFVINSLWKFPKRAETVLTCDYPYFVLVCPLIRYGVAVPDQRKHGKTAGENVTSSYEAYAQSAWSPDTPSGKHASGTCPIVVTTYTGKHRKEDETDGR